MVQDVKLAAPANSIGLAIWTHLIDGARVYLGPNADRIVIAPIVAARRHTVCRSLGPRCEWVGERGGGGRAGGFGCGWVFYVSWDMIRNAVQYANLASHPPTLARVAK